MRKIIDNVEIFIFTAIARVHWVELTRKAEKLRAETGNQICVVTSPFNQSQRLFFDKKGLSNFRKRYARIEPKSRKAKYEYSFGAMREGAWYYTNSDKPKSGMSEREYKIRRAKFIESEIALLRANWKAKRSA